VETAYPFPRLYNQLKGYTTKGTIPISKPNNPKTLFNERSIAQYVKEFWGNELRWNEDTNQFETCHEIYTNEGMEWEFSPDALSLLSMWVSADWQTVKQIIRKTIIHIQVAHPKDKRVQQALTALTSPSSFVAISDHLKELLRYNPLDELNQINQERTSTRTP
jgi:hypothetical protein